MTTSTMRKFEPLFPIKKKDLFTLYNQAVQSFWTAQEIDIANDDISKLTESERHILATVLSFFAASDLIVNENIAENLYKLATYPEAKMFLAFQSGVESIHTHLYSLLLEAYFGTNTDLFKGIENNPRIRAKAEFCEEFMKEANGELLIAFACCEGIFFSSSFASIYHFKKSGALPGLTTSNEFISRDEALHARFTCALYLELVKDGHIEAVPESRIVEIVQRSCNLEIDFVNDVLANPVLGFTADAMSDHVRFVADRILQMLEVAPVFNIPESPLPCVEICELSQKANFFEVRNSEYKKIQGERVFSLDADF